MSEALAVPTAANQIASVIFAVVLLDPQGVIVEVNSAGENLLGRSAQRLSGRRLEDVLAIGDARVWDSVADNEAPLVARDVPARLGNEERRVNLTCSPLPMSPGWRVLTLSETGIGTGENEDGGGLRGPAILAHEIKNPLAAIRGAGQLLARRVVGRDRPLTEIIAAEVDRIADLVDRMQQLGSSRSVRTRACNLHESIRSALASVRAGRRGDVDLVEEFDPSLPAVAADPAALEQVIINLVSNACDASAALKQPQVEIRTRFISGLVLNVVTLGKATRLPVEIVVSDAGPGIDPALRDHVFEPFVTSKPHGQGLGLALVRKLVRDMGGRIVHERDEKAGLTRFRINLAVAREEGR